MSNEYEIVRQFEAEIAVFAGSKFAISVESCTSAIFLSCWYYFNEMEGNKILTIPKRTYPGVIWSVIHAGGKIRWSDVPWFGCYRLSSSPIVDSAKRFMPKMYMDGTFWCLSFHYKKRIAIGRGGMILTDNQKAAAWFKRARFDGRRECALIDDYFDHVGWNMYMTPDQAARGLTLFHANKDFDDLAEIPDYPDLSQYEIFKSFVD